MTDGEWSEAVDAAQAVDPTLTAPSLTGTDVSAVGGGKVVSGASVAFSVSRRDGDVRGRMTMTSSAGATFSADVVCIGAVVAPSGQGGEARFAGTVTAPASVQGQKMAFDVIDSGGPGDDEDFWSGSLRPASDEPFTCELPESPPIDPLVSGNFAVRSLD